jgi:hypothetical protein
LATRLTVAGDLPDSYPWTVRLDAESACAATECAYTGLPCVSPSHEVCPGTADVFPCGLRQTNDSAPAR